MVARLNAKLKKSVNSRITTIFTVPLSCSRKSTTTGAKSSATASKVMTSRTRVSIRRLSYKKIFLSVVEARCSALENRNCSGQSSVDASDDSAATYACESWPWHHGQEVLHEAVESFIFFLFDQCHEVSIVHEDIVFPLSKRSAIVELIADGKVVPDCSFWQGGHCSSTNDKVICVTSCKPSHDRSVQYTDHIS